MSHLKYTPTRLRWRLLLKRLALRLVLIGVVAADDHIVRALLVGWVGTINLAEQRFLRRSVHHEQ